MPAPYFADDSVTLHLGDALTVARTLDTGSVDCIVTSPPYFGLRSYLDDDHPDKYAEHGAEPDPRLFVERLVRLFRELGRVLADDGTLWLNLGDSYATQGGVRTVGESSWTAGQARTEVQPTKSRSRPTDITPKNLRGIPWRVAFALQDDGWILRNDVIWSKPNAMPESVTDRLSSRHEHLFMLTKSQRYHFDLDAIREQYDGDRALSRRSRSGATNKENSIAQPWGRAEATPPRTKPQTNFGPTGERNGKFHEKGRNPGDVWEIATQPFPGAHFATMPVRLAERCIQAGCKPGGTVLDPFSGSGTTGLAAARHGRRYVGIDLNADYLNLSLRTRLQAPTLDLGGTA
ncbi:site-specific DNA-methyltransferase [Tsukamurella asaccharolytica]|uniref:Methyltransferase n=1 Tax=Tsukamurella asaccharolytica TaxID=2592067 RepID=A0A5C5RF09_9ACTN|nr:site-specific DNA-methyltransferase [Tsukamurella asaccharolytica]TWS20983.1 site-specific DNA-methyltransferase [Tsukamurella asaccharolytica]